jgi:hypothetical protein
MATPLRVVLAHGRAADLEIAASMSRLWGDALLQGLQRVGSPYADRVEVAYAFFGGLWRRDADTDKPKPKFAGVDGEEYTVRLTPDAAVIPVTEVEFGIPLGPISRFVTKILPEKALEGLLATAIPDVFDYLDQATWRNAANTIVAKTCVDSGAKVLIGFSMGTIVGYDVLRSQGANLPVRAFLTCGSPIGMGPIHKRLAAAGGTPFPASIGQWLNIWNDDDAATGIHGDELAALFPGGVIQSAQTWAREASPTNPFAAHNAPDYLSSLAMGLALHVALSAVDD